MICIFSIILRKSDHLQWLAQPKQHRINGSTMKGILVIIPRQQENAPWNKRRRNYLSPFVCVIRLWFYQWWHFWFDVVMPQINSVENFWEMYYRSSQEICAVYAPQVRPESVLDKWRQCSRINKISCIISTSLNKFHLNDWATFSLTNDTRDILMKIRFLSWRTRLWHNRTESY